ncbi:MAG: hypothetical protein ACREDX_03430 [Aestuariivirga sp.]
MLGVSSYDKATITACKRAVTALMKAYLADASPAFEQEFLRHMVPALDRLFVHRLRGKEGKDGNALNEVRMLCTSICEGKKVLLADSTIKYQPEKSILKLKIGDEIKLTPESFGKLAGAFFREIEAKFGS